MLLSNSVIFTDFPLADHQKQFTQAGNVVGYYFSPSTDTLNPYNWNESGSLAANSLYLVPMTPNVNCTVNSIAVALQRTNTSDPDALFQVVIYADSSNLPGALLSAGTSVRRLYHWRSSRPASNFAAVARGRTQYWIGLMNDTAISLALYTEIDPSSSSGQVSRLLTGQRLARTYTLGAPTGWGYDYGAEYGWGYGHMHRGFDQLAKRSG